jgi:hypothetical protein
MILHGTDFQLKPTILSVFVGRVIAHLSICIYSCILAFSQFIECRTHAFCRILGIEQLGTGFFHKAGLYSLLGNLDSQQKWRCLN